MPRLRRAQGGSRGLTRIRVGQYRVVYAVDDDKGEMTVVRVRHRSDAYAR